MKFVRLLPVLAGFLVCLPAAENSAAKLPRDTPEAQGISSAAILGFLDAAEDKIDALHSFMLVRHGRVIAEGWWSPYAADEPHTLFSLSKSFTSTAVGLAMTDGKLSVDDPVLKFFPDEAPAQPSANLAGMRVRDLLTMTTGHRDETIRNFPFESQADLVKLFFAQPVDDKPGTHFVYNSTATFMLSAIVQKVTGQNVRDYLRPRLFEPLGMGTPVWEQSAAGISFGAFGLHARTEDIARFGQLYLQKGVWQGKQLVPAGWVDLATARQVSNGSNPASDWDQGYGFQFWRCQNGAYRGDGAFCQFCIVLPQQGVVIAITAASQDYQGVMNLVWEHLLPALQNAELPADQAAHQKLTTKLASLTLRPQTGAATSPTAAKIAGKRFVFSDDRQEVESIKLGPTASDGRTTWTVRISGTDQKIEVVPNSWRKGTLTAGSNTGVFAASGAWTADNIYTLKLCRYRTPFTTTYRFTFANGTLVLDAEENVSFGNPRAPQVEGKPE